MWNANKNVAYSAGSYPEHGWTAPQSATPLKVGAADVAFNSIVSQLISAGTIDADIIQAGTLTVGGAPNATDLLIVKAGDATELLRIDQYGLVAIDPTDPLKAMRWWQGRLEFTTDYDSADPNSSTWSTAITADGITADAILLGSLMGGHNAIPNSGFELSGWVTYSTKTWTSAVDWQSHLTGSDENVDDSGTELKLTAYS
jgi:hypothetical protein